MRTDSVQPQAPLPPLAVGAICPECGYDLRGLTASRCPECGHDLALVRAGHSEIPWVHRRRLGRVRAYFATVEFVLRRGRRFRRQIALPVDYAGAQKFRWITVVLVYLSLAAWLGLHAWHQPESYREAITMLGLPTAMTVPIAAFLAILLASGAHTYLFHPRLLPVRVQNRAIAMSYYAIAPLALVVPGTALVLIAVFVLWLYRIRFLTDRWFPNEGLGWLILALGLILLPAGCLLAWAQVSLLSWRVVQAPLRSTMTTVLAPLLWLVVLVLILSGVPAVVFWLHLVWLSLRG